MVRNVGSQHPGGQRNYAAQHQVDTHGRPHSVAQFAGIAGASLGSHMLYVRISEARSDNGACAHCRCSHGPYAILRGAKFV